MEVSRGPGCAHSSIFTSPNFLHVWPRRGRRPLSTLRHVYIYIYTATTASIVTDVVHARIYVYIYIYIYFVFFSLPRLLNTLCLFLFPRVRYILINCARPPSISLMMTANERNSLLPSPLVCTLSSTPFLDTHIHTHLNVDHAQLISYSAREHFFTTRSLTEGLVLTNHHPSPQIFLV